MAALLWIAVISLTNTASAVMHEAGLTAASANMNQSDSDNATISAATEGQASSNATSTVVRDSVFAYLDDRLLPADNFIHLYDRTHTMHREIATVGLAICKVI